MTGLEEVVGKGERTERRGESVPGRDLNGAFSCCWRGGAAPRSLERGSALRQTHACAPAAGAEVLAGARFAEARGARRTAHPGASSSSCGAGRPQVNAPFVPPRPQQTRGRTLLGASGSGTAATGGVGGDTPRPLRSAALRRGSGLRTGPRLAPQRRGGERNGRGRRGWEGRWRQRPGPLGRSPPQSPADAPRLT